MKGEKPSKAAVEDIKEKLAGIVGKSKVTEDPFHLKKNSTDATQIKSNPFLVVYPTDKNQVLEIVKLANEMKLPIVPRGGGSGLCGGATANNSIVVNMTKLNRIIKIDKKSKYAVVQAGIILDKLNKKLERKGLYFPVQPASHKLATIGGMISTNAGGEHALRFGKMIDNLLELEVVTGNGQLVKARKDRIKHFCGTEGLMGVVVEAKLKLLPQIRQKSITVHEASDIGDLMKLVKGAIKDKSLIACEFINPKVYRMEGFHKKYFLLLEYKWKKGEIVNDRQIKKYWKVREKCFNILFKQGWKIIADPQLPIKNLHSFLSWCDKNNLPAFGHIGHGIIHVHFKDNQKIRRMYSLVSKLQGIVSGEHGIGIIKRKYIPRKLKVKLIHLKQIYDKSKILNTGKVI